jgi:hypothetical protein
MPVAFTVGPITQRDLQFEALGSRFITHSNTASGVQHGLCQSRLISSDYRKDSRSSGSWSLNIASLKYSLYLLHKPRQWPDGVIEMAPPAAIPIAPLGAISQHNSH